MNKFELLDGKISVANLRTAFEQIRHRPEDEQITALIDKLDVDHDGFVPIEDVTSLAEVEGLGIVIDETADELIGQGQEIRDGSAAAGGTAAAATTTTATAPASSGKAQMSSVDQESSSGSGKSKLKKEEQKRIKREDVVED